MRCVTRPYDRLWSFLDATAPNPQAFLAKVETLTGPELVALYTDTIDASGELPARVAGLSDDEREDLADWLLGQGYEVWKAACDADEVAMTAHFDDFSAEQDGDLRRWKGATPPVAPSFYGSFSRRFGADDFFDLVDEELERRN